MRTIIDGVAGFALLLLMALLAGSVVGWLGVQLIERVVEFFDV